MPWLRHFALLLVFVTALFRPAAAGAFVSAPDAGPQARVGAFELVAATLVGPASGATCGVHEGIGAAYDENASGYRFAARGGGGLVDDAVRASTPVGRRGAPLTVPPGTNAPATIGGRNFTGHALDQMQSRGFTPTVVENAIQHGARTPGNQAGTFQHVFEGVRVITNEAGGVITVIPR
jgi:hypothetical protein